MKLKLYFIFLFLIGFSAFAQPVANFSADKTSGCAPLVVQFTDLSTNGATSWRWEFGNGNTSTLKNPGAFYTTAGVYTVKLTATNAQGSNVLTKTGYITVYPTPKARFTTPDSNACAPINVQFTDISINQGAPINNWYWTFGDGTSSTQQNPAHLYPNTGNYSVYLAVKDTNGCSDYLLKEQYIKTSKVTANFSFNNSACPPPVSVPFTNLSTGTRSGLTYSWTFGDGGVSTATNPNHTFTTYNTFDVKLIVKDAIGCKDSVSKNMFVIKPQADFDFNVTCTNTTFSINFTDRTTPAASFWNWNFGNGGTSTVKNPTNNYTANQTYTIQLISGSSSTCKDTITKTYTPPIVNFFADSFSCESPFVVNFNNVSTGDSLQYLWNFGGASTSTTINPTQVFTTTSSLAVINTQLRGTDRYGCVRVQNKNITISKPEAKFSADKREGCVPLKVNFTNLSTSADSIVSYQWNFGNDSTSTLKNPSVTYADSGHFNVTLIVTTQSGCVDTLIMPKYIVTGFKPILLDFTTFDTLCMHNPQTWVGICQFADPNVVANYWYWSFPYYPSGSSLPTNTYTSQDVTYNVKDWWFLGYDTIYFKAGHNGCYVDTMKIPYTAGPNSLADNDNTSWAFCSSPAVAKIANATQDYTEMLGFYITDLSNGQITNLNPDTLVMNNVLLTHAGKYTLTIIAKNDTSRLGGCTDFYPDFLLVVDSVVQKYTFEPTVECLNKTNGTPVAFTDSSKSFFGTITNYYWDFGDGQGSTLQHPIHYYTSPGTFIVTQTITTMLSYQYNGIFSGKSCNYIKTDTVVIHSLNALFTADDIGICPGNTVSFTENSTTTSNNITDWRWTFGDGSASVTTQNPSHTYQNVGSYSVKLYIKDDRGCTDSLTKAAYIVVTKPIANFTPSKTNGCENDIITFTSSSTGNIVKYRWDFGDGSLDSSSATQTHRYTSIGTYNITLKVTDVNGCDSSITKSVTIHANPIAAFTADNVFADCPPLPVAFSDTSTSASNIQSWLWNFGNGTTSTLQNPNHVYTIPGTYDVSLIVTNVYGCKDTLAKNPYINLGGPSGTYTFTAATTCIPFPVLFEANCINTTKYSWDFGDGTILEEANDTVNHEYSDRGSFTPVLVLEDSMGCKFIVPSTRTITANGILAKFSASNYDLCNSENIFFSNETTIYGATTFLWHFGDGDSSNVANPNHLFTNVGSYEVVLSAKEATGCSSSVSKTITVLQKPDIGVSGELKACIPYNAVFEASKIGNAQSNIQSWLWDFGNNVTTTENPAKQTYTTIGEFNVNLTGYYGGECSVNKVLKITTYKPPVADFNFSPDYIVMPGTEIKFNSTSTGVTAWNWNFGNNDFSEIENPTYAYQQGGTFNVTLTVFDELGCPDSISKSLGITPQIPNVYTPNGDGINDNFYIPGVEDRNCVLFIYNRWGELVFSTDNYKNEWYGKSKNGNPLSDGVYFYHIDCEYIKNTKGWVQILGNK